jgi:hypothetical protein
MSASSLVVFNLPSPHVSVGFGTPTGKDSLFDEQHFSRRARNTRRTGSASSFRSMTSVAPPLARPVKLIAADKFRECRFVVIEARAGSADPAPNASQFGL